MKPPKIMSVQAGAGSTVKLLDGRTLKPSETAHHVPWSLYLQRRLACADLLDVTPPVEVPVAQAAPIASPSKAPIPPAAQPSSAPASPAPAPDATKGTAP